MTALPHHLSLLLADTSSYTIAIITEEIANRSTDAGYEIVEINDTKPWGAYLRLHGDQADTFVGNFFDDLTPEQARLGNPNAELSPKFLIVTSNQRLSLQTHARRAERWRFLTPGFYYKGTTPEDVRLYEATDGEVVQFEKGDIHRLSGADKGFVVVAEIWQHTDPDDLSDENDIERLEDDYSR
jgi:mannose-6-phosphate isomerase-like protein (cupin superfamily)